MYFILLLVYAFLSFITIGSVSYGTTGWFPFFYTWLFLCLLLFISFLLCIRYYLKLGSIFGILGCILIGFLLLYQLLGFLKIGNTDPPPPIEIINGAHLLVFLCQFIALLGFGFINIFLFALTLMNDGNDEKIIRSTALDFGIKYSRIEIREISEKCNKDPRFIIQIVKKMIENQEIYAEYFPSTKSVAFNKNANIGEIDHLMKKFKEWENTKTEKK